MFRILGGSIQNPESRVQSRCPSHTVVTLNINTNTIISYEVLISVGIHSLSPPTSEDRRKVHFSQLLRACDTGILALPPTSHHRNPKKVSSLLEKTHQQRRRPFSGRQSIPPTMKLSFITAGLLACSITAVAAWGKEGEQSPC